MSDAQFARLRARVLNWIDTYRGREHLLRTEHWLRELEPRAPGALAIAALTHDIERAVPGGPAFDLASTTWDDPAYNQAHCERSARVVGGLLTSQRVDASLVERVQRAVSQHELGGSPDGDLLQAADSISFLEVSAGLVAGWVLQGGCDRQKAEGKLRWMCERVRLEAAREVAERHCARALEELRRRLAHT